MRRPAQRSEGFPTRLQAVVDRYGSIQAVSDATGQAPKTISDWLRGVRVPHASTLKKFCEGVEVLPNWLLHGTRDPNDGVVLSRTPLPPLQSANVEIHFRDNRESITSLSPSWLAWRFGVRSEEDIAILHATADDAIPGEVEAEEPVLFRMVKPGYMTSVGEIVLLGDQVGVERVYKVPESGNIPGIVLGTALWTGHRLNKRLRPKNA